MSLGVCHLLLESDFPGESASSLRVSHDAGITARREGLTRKIDVDEPNMEEASAGSILNDKQEEPQRY